MSLLRNSQRSLRHVCSILLRNVEPFDYKKASSARHHKKRGDDAEVEGELDVPPGLRDLYFTLHTCRDDGNTDAEPIYQSEISRSTLNPSWRPLESHRYTKYWPKTTFVLRVYDASPHHDTPTKVLDVMFDLSNLVYLCKERGELPSTAPNSLLVELIDGFYTLQSHGPTVPASATLADAKRHLSITPISQAEGGDREETKFLSLDQAISLQEQIQERQWQLRGTDDEIETLRGLIKDKLSLEAKRVQQIARREEHALRIRRLRREYNQQRVTLDRLALDCHIKREKFIPRGKEISKSVKMVIIGKGSLDEMRKDAEEEAVRRARIREQLEMRRWVLVNSLQGIYPIREAPIKNCLTIRNLPLPTSDFENQDEETLSTALGYLCHLVVLTAKYFDVPLTHKIKFMSSRSMICDESSSDGQIHDFPLFLRKVDPARFKFALPLLNRNVEQLLSSQGISYKHYHYHYILSNMQSFLAKSAQIVPKATSLGGGPGQPSFEVEESRVSYGSVASSRGDSYAPRLSETPRVNMYRLVEFHGQPKNLGFLKTAARGSPVDLVTYLQEAVDAVNIGPQLKVYVPFCSNEIYEVNFPTTSREFACRRKAIFVSQNSEDKGQYFVLAMYVYEFITGKDDFAVVSYLDSTGYYTPMEEKGVVYKTVVDAYLRFCREIGMSELYIWAVAPSNSTVDYVFFDSHRNKRKKCLDQLKLTSWFIRLLKDFGWEYEYNKNQGCPVDVLSESDNLWAPLEVRQVLEHCMMSSHIFTVNLKSKTQDGEDGSGKGENNGMSDGEKSNSHTTAVGGSFRPKRADGDAAATVVDGDVGVGVSEPTTFLAGKKSESPSSRVVRDATPLRRSIASNRLNILSPEYPFDSVSRAKSSTRKLLKEFANPNDLSAAKTDLSILSTERSFQCLEAIAVARTGKLAKSQYDRRPTKKWVEV